VGAISKDSINPFFKSNYFDINKLIEVIKPILNDLGLVLLQPLSSNPTTDRLTLKTMIIDSETGQTLVESNAVLPENTDPQKMGSTITYYRRYALQSLLFLQAEDDDGNSATLESRPPIRQTAASRQPDKKAVIASLLKKAMPGIETADDYKEASKTLTGFDLVPGNYQNIINILSGDVKQRQPS
ncbi:MAG TPA: ERF family protein, partial [Bacteroidota bacterium]|nr:ERF family protein [Bacteroidota bacterium]